MTDDPRKPKIIIPEDANYMALRKHKQTLDDTGVSTEELPILEGNFIQGSVKNGTREGYMARAKIAMERYIRQQKEKQNG